MAYRRPPLGHVIEGRSRLSAYRPSNTDIQVLSPQPSTFLSFVRLVRALFAVHIAQQSFCQEIDSTDPHILLSEKDWEAIQFIVQALEPAKEATKKLQSELLTLGIAIIHV